MTPTMTHKDGHKDTHKDGQKDTHKQHKYPQLKHPTKPKE